MIPQGSNNPLVVKFDASVEGLEKLVVSLWCDRIGMSVNALKVWEYEDMVISGDTAVCPLTEEETASLPRETLVLLAKGLDGEGKTVFWDEYKINVLYRRDKVIKLTQVEGGA